MLTLTFRLCIAALTIGLFSVGGTAFGDEPADQCVCKTIKLRGNAPDTKPLGPDGDGKKPWPKYQNGTAIVWSGTTLGPYNGDPDNPTVNGEKKYTGFTFEVVCDITGVAKLCKQIQLIKATDHVPGMTEGQCKQMGGTYDATAKACDLPKTWIGTSYDPTLGADPTAAVDVSTKDKCFKAGGQWSAKGKVCRLKFPQSGSTFGPDAQQQGETGGAYEEPWTYKVHLKDKILWVDPSGGTSPVDGWTRKSDFIALIKSTDNKYCYVAFTVEWEKKQGPDLEKMTESSSGCDKTWNQVPKVK